MKTIQKIKATLGLLALFLHPAVEAVAQSWSAAGDFSPTNNPNGVWSYGWSQTLGSLFILDTASESQSGIDRWLGQQWPDGNPSVNHNATPTAITPFNSVTFQPGQLGFHPGPNGENAIVRFTAPATGSYNVDAAFVGLDFVGPTTTDVHILVRGASVFDGNVNGFGPGSGPTFSTNLTLNAGDTVDFDVGVGQDGSFAYDMTGLDATITSSIRDLQLAIARDDSGGLFVRYTGAPDVTYRLQRAANLTGPWTNLATNTAPASGLIEFHETTPPPGQAFYRTIQP